MEFAICQWPCHGHQPTPWEPREASSFLPIVLRGPLAVRTGGGARREDPKGWWDHSLVARLGPGTGQGWGDARILSVLAPRLFSTVKGAPSLCPGQLMFLSSFFLQKPGQASDHRWPRTAQWASCASAWDGMGGSDQFLSTLGATGQLWRMAEVGGTQTCIPVGVLSLHSQSFLKPLPLPPGNCRGLQKHSPRDPTPALPRVSPGPLGISLLRLSTL